MEALSKLVKSNPFSSPFQHANCEGLKVNETRTIAAAAASQGSYLIISYLKIYCVNNLCMKCVLNQTDQSVLNSKGRFQGHCELLNPCCDFEMLELLRIQVIFLSTLVYNLRNIY